MRMVNEDGSMTMSVSGTSDCSSHVSMMTPTAYVQGMNMIVGHFLKHVDEPRAFRLFCHIMVQILCMIFSIL